jgi:hypothetical protein
VAVGRRSACVQQIAGRAGAPPKPLLLSAAQHATLEALVETIIPADERSPGAKARVADYVDLLLSESDDEVKLQWLGGLAELDEKRSPAFGSRAPS